MPWSAAAGWSAGIQCENCHNFNRVSSNFRRGGAGLPSNAADVARLVAAVAAPEGQQPDPAEEARILGRFGNLRANFSVAWGIAAP